MVQSTVRGLTGPIIGLNLQWAGTSIWPPITPGGEEFEFRYADGANDYDDDNQSNWTLTLSVFDMYAPPYGIQVFGFSFGVGVRIWH